MHSVDILSESFKYMHKQHLLIGRCKLHQREKKALLHMICTSSPFAVRVSASSPIEAERKIK